MNNLCVKLAILSGMTILVMASLPNSQKASAHAPQTENGSATPDPPPQDRDRDRDARQNPDDFQPITLSEGTVIPIRMADAVNSNHDKTGTMFTGTVDPSVLIHDTVVIPRGTEAHVRMVEAKKGGHIHGKAKVRLELTSLIINGQRLGVDSSTPSKKQGALEAKTSAVAKKSAKCGEGAATGGSPDFTAGAGPIIAAFTAAKVEVKPGSRIEFRLESPFTFDKPPSNTADSR